jgi:hypothetical protein
MASDKWLVTFVLEEGRGAKKKGQGTIKRGKGKVKCQKFNQAL